MPEHESLRQKYGRIGALNSWANTPDRSARTRNGRAKSPASIEWHEARLDPERFADASDADRRKAAESARKAYYSELAMKSAAARRGAA